MLRAAAALALAALSACAHVGLQQRPVAIQRNTVRTTSGLEYEDLFQGAGMAVTTSDIVTFDYTVWLENGERVDSTLDRGVPLHVALESAPVRGLRDGMIGMQSGGRRRLTVPPNLAYGTEGVPDLIPPGATLIFEVHLIEVGSN